MITLNYQDIVDILNGAAFLGGGGGGPLDIALNMLKEYKDRTVSLYEAGELSEEDHAAVIAAMGNPTKAAGKDFNSILTNTFRNIDQTCTSCRITSVIAGECGGFNTFAPIYVALNHPEIKLIDTEASGRAVPGLDTSLASVRGVQISPFVLTSEYNEWVAINTKSQQNISSPQKCEEIARFVAGTSFFGDVGGIAGWVMDKRALSEYTVVGGISKCRTVGKAIRDYKAGADADTNIFDYLSAHAGITCRMIVKDAHLTDTPLPGAGEEGGGFEYGVFYVFSGSEKLHCGVRYLNEFLVCRRARADSKLPAEEVAATAPTIITLFDEENFVPITDSILKDRKEELKHTRLSLGLVSVADTWGRLGMARNSDTWRKYLKMVNYTDECVIF